MLRVGILGRMMRDAKPVSEVLEYLVAHWPSHASWSLDESSQPHEAQLLKLDISKAKARLKWAPRWDLNKAMQTIIEWHFAWVNGEDMKAFSLNQIGDFERNFELKIVYGKLLILGSPFLEPN